MHPDGAEAARAPAAAFAGAFAGAFSGRARLGQGECGAAPLPPQPSSTPPSGARSWRPCLVDAVAAGPTQVARPAAWGREQATMPGEQVDCAGLEVEAKRKLVASSRSQGWEAQTSKDR